MEEKVVIELKIVLPRLCLREINGRIQKILNYLLIPVLKDKTEFTYIVDGEVEEAYSLNDY